MAEIVLMKTPGGALVPVDDEGRELIAKLKTGQGVKAKVVRARNPAFHRKVMALFNLAYGAWNPKDLPVWKGETVRPSFDRFRKDLTVLAGHYTATANLKGEVRLEAKSLAFANMDEDEFQQVYAGVLNVVWDRVLKHVAGYASPDDVERVVNELLAFDAS